jgi:hypothetical protein
MVQLESSDTRERQRLGRYSGGTWPPRCFGLEGVDMDDIPDSVRSGRRKVLSRRHLFICAARLTALMAGEMVGDNVPSAGKPRRYHLVIRAVFYSTEGPAWLHPHLPISPIGGIAVCRLLNAPVVHHHIRVSTHHIIIALNASLPLMIFLFL